MISFINCREETKQFINIVLRPLDFDPEDRILVVDSLDALAKLDESLVKDVLSLGLNVPAFILKNFNSYVVFIPRKNLSEKDTAILAGELAATYSLSKQRYSIEIEFENLGFVLTPKEFILATVTKTVLDRLIVTNTIIMFGIHYIDKMLDARRSPALWNSIKEFVNTRTSDIECGIERAIEENKEYVPSGYIEEIKRVGKEIASLLGYHITTEECRASPELCRLVDEYRETLDVSLIASFLRHIISMMKTILDTYGFSGSVEERKVESIKVIAIKLKYKHKEEDTKNLEYTK